MPCFTTLGEHDVLKNDKPTMLKVTPLFGDSASFDEKRGRHVTLTCPPEGAEMLSFTALCEHDAKSDTILSRNARF